MKLHLISASHRWLVVAALTFVLVLPAAANPPALPHTFYGMARDEFGSPLGTNAVIILESASGVQIQARIIPGLDPGVNYRLSVPLDASLSSEVYKPTALQPTLPFRIRVKVGKITYLPIEMVGDHAQMGEPGKRTRLNLSLGQDLDGDGLPDGWERMINSDITKVRPGDDADKDGLRNLDEYLAGTYAFDSKSGFSLKIMRVGNGIPVLEFIAITGRNYTVHGSTDLKTWAPVDFRLSGSPPETAVVRSYQAMDVRPMQVEVPPPPGRPAPTFFRLLLQ